MVIKYLLKLFQWLIDLSEVWSLFIPLFFYKKQPKSFNLVVFYLWMSLFLNILINIIWLVNAFSTSKDFSNGFLYNILSVFRFYLLSTFFISLNQPFLKTLKLLIPIFFTIFLIIDFGFYEDFFDFNNFSSRLLAFEAFCLLFYALQYYLFEIIKESSIKVIGPEFWMITGLGIYTSFNFFLFLMFHEVSIYFSTFTISNIWNFHNISYLIFNIFIAKTFYENRKSAI